jgi:hypothetical protein
MEIWVFEVIPFQFFLFIYPPIFFFFFFGKKNCAVALFSSFFLRPRFGAKSATVQFVDGGQKNIKKYALCSSLPLLHASSGENKLP